MTSKPETISPLRARMIQDMRVRNFVHDTQREYIRAVKKLATEVSLAHDLSGLGSARSVR